MGTWNNKRVASLKKANDTDDGEGEEVEGGYNSDTGRSRESLGWQMGLLRDCLLYTSPSPRDLSTSRMPSSA